MRSGNKTATAVIMQPTYLPWIGYFDLMDQSDIFVFLDSVQFTKRSWQQRNRIKSADGELMLTVPVLSKGLRDQKISETAVDVSSDFRRKHSTAIEHAYARAPHYAEYSKEFHVLLAKGHSSLAELNIELIRWLAGSFGIRKEFVRSSQTKVAGRSSELLVGICRELGVSRYLSAAGSREYIEEEKKFEGSGLELVYHDYHHPEYSQMHGAFLPYLSALDLLFNEGGTKGLEILRAGRVA